MTITTITTTDGACRIRAELAEGEAPTLGALVTTELGGSGRVVALESGAVVVDADRALEAIARDAWSTELVLV